MVAVVLLVWLVPAIVVVATMERVPPTATAIVALFLIVGLIAGLPRADSPEE